MAVKRIFGGLFSFLRFGGVEVSKRVSPLSPRGPGSQPYSTTYRSAFITRIAVLAPL